MSPAATVAQCRMPAAGLGASASLRRRLLLVGSHVVQYSSPVFRELSRDPRLEILVAYCTLQGAQACVDPEFGVEVTWDTPLLDGYPWTHVPNRSLRPGLGRFFGLLNPGLWKLLREGKFDAVYISGYFYASAWIAILAAKWFGVPILFTTDAHSLRTWVSQSPWRLRLKKFLVKRILSLGQVLLAGSTGTVAYLKSLGFSEDRIVLVRNVVDNDWWRARAQEADRDAVRASWRIPAQAATVLFCGKLQPWKQPQDVLQAFAQADVQDSRLVFAGDGPLRDSLEARAKALGISARVRFLGFVNQSQLPGVYRASDLLVLASVHEAFGLVVNEAMACGCPAVVSDRVGAKFDLVRRGETGFIYPAGDVAALAKIFREALSDPERLRRLGEEARVRMESWSPREFVESMAGAVELASGRARQTSRLAPVENPAR